MLETRESLLPIQHRFLLRVFTTVGNPATFPTYKSPFNISNAQVFFYTDFTQSKWSLCMHKKEIVSQTKTDVKKFRNSTSSRRVAVGKFANVSGTGGVHLSPPKQLLQKKIKHTICIFKIAKQLQDFTGNSQEQRQWTNTKESTRTGCNTES